MKKMSLKKKRWLILGITFVVAAIGWWFLVSIAEQWVLSVALFSSVHIINYIGAYPFDTILLCFVQYIPAGLCLAGAYRLSGSLLSPILIHALVNLVGMLALR